MTVTGIVTTQVPPMEKVTVTVPVTTPPTTPVVRPAVAMPELLLVQVPLPLESVNVIVEPTHTACGPVMGTGEALTVTGAMT